jgi:fructose-specific phosphotransferase system IIC component
VAEALWALAVTIPAASDALGLYDRVTHWGKLVHGVEGGLLAALTAFVLLGYADRTQFGLPRQLAALASVCVGITAGVVWEFVEFVIDWVTSGDMQKSNADTMTDLLWSNLAAAFAAVLAVRLYHHLLDERARAALGVLGDALFTPIGHALDSHGKLAFLLMVLILAASIAGLWFTGRPVPGLPIE